MRRPAHDVGVLARIASAIFDWRVEDVAGQTRVTAYGATAGFGNSDLIAKRRAVEATIRDLCTGLDLDDAKRSLMRAVWEYGREIGDGHA